MSEHIIVPHELSVWRKLKSMAQPGDTIRTALRPPSGVSHAQWLQELLRALDEGLEVHCEECGALRHGAAVTAALQRIVEEHERETERRRAEAARETAAALAEVDDAYRTGFRDGQDSAQLAEKALAQRVADRERKREQRRREAEAAGKAQAAKAEAARKDPSSPHYIEAAA